MNLKAILKNDNKIEIKNITILGENENLYFIQGEDIDYTSIDKSALYKNINGIIFGFDRKKLICVWNELKKQQIHLLENELYELKKCILSKEIEIDEIEL